MKDWHTFHGLSGSVLNALEKVLSAIDPAEVVEFSDSLSGAKRIFIAGNGRTGLKMQAFAMRLIHLGLVTHVVGDVTTPGLMKDDLLVIGSSSGKSTSLIHYAETANQTGVPISALTASKESAIAKIARTHVYIPGSPIVLDNLIGSQNILPMGSLFENALGIALDVVVSMLMERLGITEEQMIARHTNLE